MTVDTSLVAKQPPKSAQQLIIDFLYLDLTTCTRCRGTDRSLQAGLAAAGDLLTAAGVEVEVRNCLLYTSPSPRDRS